MTITQLIAYRISILVDVGRITWLEADSLSDDIRVLARWVDVHWSRMQAAQAAETAHLKTEQDSNTVAMRPALREVFAGQSKNQIQALLDAAELDKTDPAVKLMRAAERLMKPLPAQIEYTKAWKKSRGI